MNRESIVWKIQFEIDEHSAEGCLWEALGMTKLAQSTGMITMEDYQNLSGQIFKALEKFE